MVVGGPERLRALAKSNEQALSLCLIALLSPTRLGTTEFTAAVSGYRRGFKPLTIPMRVGVGGGWEPPTLLYRRTR